VTFEDLTARLAPWQRELLALVRAGVRPQVHLYRTSGRREAKTWVRLLREAERASFRPLEEVGDA
jgi:hypothetical protein